MSLGIPVASEAVHARLKAENREAPKSWVTVLLHPNNKIVLRNLVGCTIAMLTLPFLAIYLIHSTDLILTTTDNATRVFWAGFGALGAVISIMIAIVLLAIFEEEPATPAPTPKPGQKKKRQ